VGEIEKRFGNAALKIFKGFILEKDIEVSTIDNSRVKNILFIVRHQMGDMLCALPMMRSVRNFYPEAHITLVTKHSTRFEEVFKNNDSTVDEVKYFENGFENFINIIKELREKRFDIAVIPSTVVFSATNHLIAYFSHAKIRVGVKSMDYEDNKSSYMLNIKNDFIWGPKKIHQIERNLDVIRQLNIKPLENRVKISVNETQKKFALDFLKEHDIEMNRPLIGIHPGAAKEGNVWPPEKFAELGNKFYQKFNCNIIISEGPVDSICANELEKQLKEKYKITGIFRHKGFLMNNLALINLTGLFITNDTGIMHLASGLDIPVIALFGPTKAYQWGPIGENKLSLQSSGSSIDNISPEVVYEAALSLLSSKMSVLANKPLLN